MASAIFHELLGFHSLKSEKITERGRISRRPMIYLSRLAQFDAFPLVFVGKINWRQRVGYFVYPQNTLELLKTRCWSFRRRNHGSMGEKIAKPRKNPCSTTDLAHKTKGGVKRGRHGWKE